MDPTLLIFLALVFGALGLMSRRSRRTQRAAMDFRTDLAPGQQVMTGSGFFGTVVEVDGDAITLESVGSRSVWIRGAILKLAEPPIEVPDDEADADGTGTVEVPDDISSLDPGDTGAPPST
jgi:preprotein translocase subunit YajC